MHGGVYHCFPMRESPLRDTVIHVLFTCPAHVVLGKRGTGLTTDPNPSWRSTLDYTPAKHMVPKGHQPLPSSHFGHKAFPMQHPSACLRTCSSTSLQLIFLEQHQHQARSIRIWPSYCSENAIGVYKTWGDPVKNPAVYFFPVTGQKRVI